MAQRLSQLASELWPFLLPKVSGMVSGLGTTSGGSSSGGGTTLAAHDLSGSLHRGLLADDQAPQFLMLDGSRTLTGNLAAAAGVTLDGVDLSAHAADINAHHNKAHGIVDSNNHTAIGGLQYQVVGLPSNATIGYLTPSATPGANALIKTDGSSSVTISGSLYMDGTLDFGTNTIDEDASYLQFAGSKAIRFSQNIGNAAWTVYSTGGAAFSGSVDITSGGDLTVAGSGSYAGNQVLFADSSGGNVGIMMAPDPQFALDINGPARATYWIGPHALQIKDAILIAHYDGRTPYETNFNGEPNGHMGQVAAVSGGVIYRPGKFYKAVQIAAGTTNLFADPSCEYDATLSLWAKYASAGTFTGTRSIEVQPLYGTYTGKLVGSGGASGLFYQNVTLSAGSVTISVYVRKTDKSAVTSSDCNIYTGSDNASTYTDIGGGWYRVAATVTASAGTSQIGLRVGTNKTLYVDALQCEQSAVPTPYCDGSLGTGHTWSGTAHASSSSRTAATLSYTLPTIAYDAPLTIMAWVNLDTTKAANYQYLWASDAGNGYSAYRDSSNNLYIGTVNCGAMLANWVHIAFVTTGGGGTTAYVNGINVGSTTISRYGLSAFYVGGGNAVYFSNGLIDDFAIIGRALPAAEIRAIYESNAPIFAESSTFSFRPTPKGLIWADDEGLWMRDTAGNSVLGIYGGEAASKSWAGFTMAAGDIVFGRNAVGSSAIWWDQSAGKFGFFGAGSVTPQVEIATDGSLTAGAGKVQLNSTGFHAFNASSVATIDINAEGIYLGDGGGRTTIGSWTSGNRIRAYNVAELYEATPETYLDDSSVTRTLYPFAVHAIRQGNDAALIELSAVNTSNVGAKLIIGEGFRLKDYYGSPYNTNRVIHAQATDIILEATNLQLRSLTTSTAAVGTYSGKIRIQIAGTNYYIPYYAS